MDHKLVSIIVPVYKSEKYLSYCIESILAQSYTNFELILVDDGSPDASGKICDCYAKGDKRINVYHKENSGVSAARNYGLSKSVGEYVLFIDSDDTIDYSLVDKCVRCLECCDTVYYDYTIEETDKSTRVCCADFNTNEEFINNLIKGQNTMVWNFMTKRKLYLECDITFNNHITYFEDFDVAVRIYINSSKISHIKEALYFYNKQNNESIIHNLTIDDIVTVQAALVSIFNFLSIRDDFQKYKDSILLRVLENKAELVLNNDTFHLFDNIIPESNAYIGECRLNKKLKFLVWCKINHLTIINIVVNWLRKRLNR